MKKKIQIAAGIITLGFFIGIYEFYDFWSVDFPELKVQEDAKERQVASLETEVRKLQSFAQNIQVIKQEFRELNLQLEAALEHMPRTFNFASLLRKLTMLAQNSGIEISSFKPKTDTVQKKQDTTGEVSFYETIFVEFNVQGPFTQTMVFFDQLSRLKRIVNIESVKMDMKEKVAKAPLMPVMSNIVIKTYRFSE
jgi:type IV pilus assembly protein PilO